MLVSAAIRLNPQSAMRTMNNRSKRSNLDLRGPRSASTFTPEALEGCIVRGFPRRFRICP
eukprot:12591220-Alexandrium_andersonii.AAC.1